MAFYGLTPDRCPLAAACRSNNHHIGVFCVGAAYNRWSIFNQAQISMTNSAEFSVVVDVQVINCVDALFANSFE